LSYLAILPFVGIVLGYLAVSYFTSQNFKSLKVNLWRLKIQVKFKWTQSTLRRAFWRLLGKYACICRDGVFESKADLQYHLDHLYDVEESDEWSWRDE